MVMAMYIVMTMNIYITKQNEEKLRGEKSMSGLINHLLDLHYGHLPELATSTADNLIINGNVVDETYQAPTTPAKNSRLATPRPINKGKKDYSVCKHGAVKGFCKKGCK